MIQYCVVTWEGVLCKGIDTFVVMQWGMLTDATQIALFPNPIVAGKAFRHICVDEFQIVPWIIQQTVVRPH
jgi:hypothetical protein